MCEIKCNKLKWGIHFHLNQVKTHFISQSACYRLGNIGASILFPENIVTYLAFSLIAYFFRIWLFWKSSLRVYFSLFPQIKLYLPYLKKTEFSHFPTRFHQCLKKNVFLEVPVKSEREEFSSSSMDQSINTVHFFKFIVCWSIGK